MKLKYGKSINVFGIDIAYYGIIIAMGMLIAMLLIYKEAKRTGQNVDNYYDLTIVTIICGIIGARLYYVILNGIITRMICYPYLIFEMVDLLFMVEFLVEVWQHLSIQELRNVIS